LLVVLEQTVVAVFAIERAALRREARGAARLALARQVAMYLGHVVCGLSLSDVGRLLGRDRTTVAHACARIEGLRDDPAFDRALGLLERTVRVLAGPEEGACAI
jgi:chromosomal replication initiation ATPase DnaA